MLISFIYRGLKKKNCVLQRRQYCLQNLRHHQYPYLPFTKRSPIVSRRKQATGDAAFVAKKLLKSTGKAAWIAGTTFLVLVVPLIIEMDHEQQLSELELQQASLLGTPTPQIK